MSVVRTSRGMKHNKMKHAVSSDRRLEEKMREMKRIEEKWLKKEHL